MLEDVNLDVNIMRKKFARIILHFFIKPRHERKMDG